ncbi:unnamed protein product [Vitrella brassicaformis CCMP3155]|uniref:Uncharacterized protein n=1 Tax=Vitrella brassicaformis (strain CCMP3155) TaxID=1169540 RepID=A0A0G4GUU7_VITBC|nr:unnamed protein product [Vitrella brassicaformis CCMP3155]|eukprot:CEM34590.1 unnamed protein product [Vitrella brassicaformis CCMP3155]
MGLRSRPATFMGMTKQELLEKFSKARSLADALPDKEYVKNLKDFQIWRTYALVLEMAVSGQQRLGRHRAQPSMHTATEGPSRALGSGPSRRLRSSCRRIPPSQQQESSWV